MLYKCTHVIRNDIEEFVVNFSLSRKFSFPTSFVFLILLSSSSPLSNIHITDLGMYRKSHIPDGPGYQEKFYFNPGDAGFKVFATKFAKIEISICWDQWFPKAARAMVLQGTKIMLYPTAIGSEPQDDGLDSREHWKRVMPGHTGANLVPVVASNRFGKEIITTECGDSAITFYGNSFIAGPKGEIVVANEKDKEILICNDPQNPNQFENFNLAKLMNSENLK